MPTRIDNSDSPEIGWPEIGWIEVGEEFAARLGCRPGKVPNSLASAQQILEAWMTGTQILSPVTLAGSVEVFDFTLGYDASRPLLKPFGIGRYDEDRRGMYTSRLFTAEADPRTIHVGIDIGASEGTPVFAPRPARVWGKAYLDAAGDYGGTLILETEISIRNRPGFRPVFMLFGHLSKLSVSRCAVGEEVQQGDLLGWLGGKKENGGWNPHLHWQLSFLEPMKHDLPGAVSKRNHELAKLVFPDPTRLLHRALNGWHRIDI